MTDVQKDVDADLRASPAAGPGRPRPLWMLAALAIAFGPLLARGLFDGQMSDLITFLVNSRGVAEFDRSSLHGLRLAVRFVLPALVVLALLRFTPLGRWLAFTRLSLGFLLLADVLLLLAVVDQLRYYVLSGLVTVRLVGDAAAVVCGAALCLAAVSLGLATAWHRSGRMRHRLAAAGRQLWREA